MEFQFSSRVLLLINAVLVLLAAASVVILYQVHMLVHSTLYAYGLQFNYEWAMPYWTFERLSFGLLGCIGGVGSLSMIYVIITSKMAPAASKTHTSVQRRANVESKQPIRVQKEKVPSSEVKEEKPPREVKEDGVEVMALPMVCNKCGKVFTQPLCMFDFKSGKPRLVNVCPYCNAVLAVTGNAKSS